MHLHHQQKSVYSIVTLVQIYFIYEFVSGKQAKRPLKLPVKEKIILRDGAQTDSKSYPAKGGDKGR